MTRLLKNRLFLPALAYLSALGMILYYNLTHELVNDGVWEYLAYRANIDEGWIFRQTLVNACVIPVWLPAIIHKATGLDHMVLFRMWPALFYPLMPMFTFLIARRYLGVKIAIISSILVLVNSHFLFFPDIGRVGIGLGFFAGMLWALLNRKLAWSIVFAVLVVFTHYALSIIACGLVLSVLSLTLIQKVAMRRKSPECDTTIKRYAILLLVLLVMLGVWHFGIARYSGFTMLNTGLQTDTSQGGSDPTEFFLIEYKDLYTIESRGETVQKAFFTTWGEESTPARIEIIANWLVVLLLTLGLYRLLKLKTDFQLKAIGISFYCLVTLTLLVPWLSSSYGVVRSLFTGFGVLAPCFALGADYTSGKLRIPIWFIAMPVLILYALSTSGLIYLPFGLEKTFPAVITLK